MTAPLPDPDHEHAINAAMAEYMASKGKPETERMRLWVAFLDDQSGQKQADLTTTD